MYKKILKYFESCNIVPNLIDEPVLSPNIDFLTEFSSKWINNQLINFDLDHSPILEVTLIFSGIDVDFDSILLPKLSNQSDLIVCREGQHSLLIEELNKVVELHSTVFVLCDFNVIMSKILNYLKCNSSSISVPFKVTNIITLCDDVYLPNRIDFDPFLINALRLSTNVLSPTNKFEFLQHFNNVAQFHDIADIPSFFPRRPVSFLNFHFQESFKPVFSLEHIYSHVPFKIDKAQFLKKVNILIHEPTFRTVHFVIGKLFLGDQEMFVLKRTSDSQIQLFPIDDSIPFQSKLIGLDRGVLIVGTGLKTFDVKDILFGTKEDKVVKSRSNLTVEDMKFVNKQSKLLNISPPEGWFFNGNYWVSIDGNGSLFHPNQLTIVDDLIEESNHQ
ncbi:hypothetical protein GEMRC1_009352 [Eukaryota sp. GEM-RC1]